MSAGAGEIMMQEAELPSPVPEQNPAGIQSPPPIPRRPFIVGIFIGPDGLRAGWRLLLYLAMFAAPYVGLGDAGPFAPPQAFAPDLASADGGIAVVGKRGVPGIGDGED